MSSELQDFAIKRTSTADQVATVLRERILRGDLAPGTPLREVAVASTLGVSRNTVREGIKVLVAEGLLTHNVHRGVTVTAVSTQDVRDIYLVRSSLETKAISQMDLSPDGPLAAMEATIRDLDAVVRRDDHEAIVDLDFQFHRQIVESLGSARLNAFYSNTLAELRLALFVLDREEGEWRSWIVHHRQILDALRARRRSEAAKLAARHLTEAEERLLRIVDATS